MKRERFPISSDQMELLLAFEAAGNLEKLAGLMARDPSVVSRNLQRLAGEVPVLVKAGGRWRLSPLGRQLNVVTRQYLAELEKLTGGGSPKRSVSPSPVPEHSLLVLINAQRALHDPARGRRSNAGAEANIRKLLSLWRKKRRPIVHVPHLSESPSSFFYRKGPGVEFISGLGPLGNEPVIEKTKASAFTGTRLEAFIRQLKVEAVVLVGFTGGDCIDATARQASDLGFRTFVVGDATATFGVVGSKGRLIKADKVHKNTLDHLHAMFAEVVDTSAVAP
jgi:nicotinamidase-related amidase